MALSSADAGGSVGSTAAATAACGTCVNSVEGLRSVSTTVSEANARTVVARQSASTAGYEVSAKSAMVRRSATTAVNAVRVGPATALPCACMIGSGISARNVVVVPYVSTDAAATGV
mmetsp:Transcript_38904/g.52744  ORF Transcript_38904/g.52744 Transcript_38904/m.52744 type:complete len:117 (+) Transcript_38904:842-1192(+)